MFEIGAFIAGLIQGILAYSNKRSSWLVYALQTVFLILFSFQQKLYGNAFQNLLFLSYCMLGYWLWGCQRFSCITTLNRHKRIMMIFGTVLLWITIWRVLSLTDDPLPQLDAATTATTVVASILLLCRKLETWIVWFFNDVLYMIQYLMLSEKALYLFVLYVIWTCMAIFSYKSWLTIYKKQLEQL